MNSVCQVQPLELLEQLFQEVIIPPAVEAELFRIPAQQQARFFIHQRLYDEVLTLAGEQQT